MFSHEGDRWTQLNSHTRPVLAPKARLQTDKLTGNPLLLYPEGVVVLNATGFAILTHCDGHITFSELIQALSTLYKAEAETLRNDVEAYLLHLHNHSLISFI